MKNRIGMPVRGEDFLERGAELAELWHWVERGHVLILAPRRVGKTSFLRRLQDEPRPGWNCVFMPVESLSLEAEFVARLLIEVSRVHPSGAWRERLGAKIHQLLQGIGKVDAGPVQFNLAQALRNGWKDVGAIALNVMRSLPGKTLILIDELPIFVRNLLQLPGNGGEDAMWRARLFLNWFREIRNEQQPDREVHFVLTGSMGLDTVVQAVGMSGTINDLHVFRLGPLSPELAGRLVENLADGENLALPEVVRQEILARIDWAIPFHLQLLFGEILGQARFHGQSVDGGLVERCYDSLLSEKYRKHFNHWAERLEDPALTKPERAARKALLDAAAKDTKGISRNTVLQICRQQAPRLDPWVVVDSLVHDGYLNPVDNRWHFSSSLLRNWWLRWQVNRKSRL